MSRRYLQAHRAVLEFLRWQDRATISVYEWRLVFQQERTLIFANHTRMPLP
ncbi:hypothetical protein Pla52o_25050 [Novipirellula galeiformis]|uniref:Uncharacterized protein n=1 Tax=Novipirellula galeiformis TaxID=2528004 RepID=A0A5C6CFP5_9BACT|nr:hypothetical protein Pla52o_25050 [Novipirellula galeiformis]